jgi:Flp pilus assembly protein TadG
MLNMSHNKRRYGQKGQTLLETSLVLSTLLLMLVGIVDFGQFLFFHQVLTDRARAGARYAAVNPYDATAIQNVVVYNSSTAPGGSPVGLFGLTTSNVTVTPTPSTGTPDYVQVKISGFPIHLISPFLTKSYTPRDIIATRQTENIATTKD